MKKKLFWLLCWCLFFMAKGQESEVTNELLEHVDVILFVLQRNSLRMERYNLADLDQEINTISKQMSKEHTIFKMSLTSPHSKARLIAWDVNHEACLKIIAGKKRVPIFYHLLLDSILPISDVEDQELALLLFDCSVDCKVESQEEESQSKTVRTSFINVIVPVQDSELSMQLVFDGRVDAACGFFVQHDIFECDSPLNGIIKIDEALEKGILIKGEPLSLVQEPEFDDELLNDNRQEIIVDEFENVTLCDGFYNRFIAVKTFFNTSFKKLWSFFA
ncbi:hypothetical protein KAH94_05595 [bacterium]|nr:hypothetical protein [bacterium]